MRLLRSNDLKYATKLSSDQLRCVGVVVCYVLLMMMIPHTQYLHISLIQPALSLRDAHCRTDRQTDGLMDGLMDRWTD